MSVQLPGHSLASPHDALALLDLQLAGGGAIQGEGPDAWPGRWLPEVCAAAPDWRGALVDGLLARWPDASPSARQVLLSCLHMTGLRGLGSALGLLGLLSREPRGGDAALDLLNALVNVAADHAANVEVYARAERCLAEHPGVIFLLAALDWPRAEPQMAAQLRRCTVAEIERAGFGFPLLPGHTREAVALCADLDPTRQAAFAPHMRTAQLIHGKRDRSLKQLILKHWPALA